MPVSVTGGIEEVESLLGHFIPSLKVAELHRPASASKPIWPKYRKQTSP
jgi:hypothetical protein